MTTKTSFPVLFNQIDRMGIVHHSNYPLWFEKARRDYLRLAGASSTKIAGKGLFLPLSKLECKYKSPAKFGDEIIVTTKVISISCVKITFEYEIHSKEKDKLLATGRTVHVWTNQRIEPINLEKTAPDIYWRLIEFSELEHES